MKTTDEMQNEWAEAIEAAGVATEAELREHEAPWPKTMDELVEYISGIVDRPHDYGTCVYAMSLSAVAAYHYVASQLGVTGFQASCADMDFIRRTRRMKRFRIVDYDQCLYPQYCEEQKTPGWREYLDTHRKEFAEMAKDKLETCGDAHPTVIVHWKWLASRHWDLTKEESPGCVEAKRNFTRN